MNLEIRGYVFFICGELEWNCAEDMKKLILKTIFKILGFSLSLVRENVLHISAPKRLSKSENVILNCVFNT